MFSGCSLLSNIAPLKNWNISNGIIFSGMFSGCSSLLDKTPLEHWKALNNVLLNKMFNTMFD